MKFVFCTISFGSLSKGIHTSGGLVELHQSQYVTHVLAGDGGDKPLKGSGNFAKPPRKRERFISIPNWDIHGLGYLQGGILDFP